MSSALQPIATALLLGLLGLALAAAGTPEKRAQRNALRGPCQELVREVSGVGPQQRNVLHTCMTEKPEVQSLLEQLWKTELTVEGNDGAADLCVVPARGKARRRRQNPLKGCSVGCALNLLEEGGFDQELIDTRQCMARETGQLTEDGIFNQDELQDQLLAQVVGQPTETNIKLAVEYCPPVVNFDVSLYYRCVRSYCIKGEPPVDSFANSFLPLDALRSRPAVVAVETKTGGASEPAVVAVETKTGGASEPAVGTETI